jgi:hypothetical protein
MKQLAYWLGFSFITTLNIFSQNSLNELNIIFKHNFDNNTLGDYQFSEWNRDFLYPAWNNRQSTLDIVQDASDDANNTKALKIYYPANSLGDQEGGTNWNTMLGNKYSEIYISYDVYFMPGFQFQKGGKLPSPKAGLVEVQGHFNRPDGYDGFAGGLMFNSLGNINFYIYYPDSRLDSYGESILWGTTGYPAGYFSPSVINYSYGSGKIANADPGKWHNITFRLVANSIKSEGVGNFDGILEAYFDGVLLSQVSNILWRRTANLGIDCFRMCTFFGGNDDSWRNPIEEWIKIDNILLYTYKEGIDVPKGNTLSPNNRTINYWRKIINDSISLPNAPSNVSSNNIGKKSATINWSDNSTNENGFKIYRSLLPASNFELIGTTNSNITTFSNTGLTPNTTYFYKVLSFNGKGSSDFTSVHSLTTLPLQLPTAPSDILSANITKNSATISWTDNSNNEDGFDIYCSLSANENFAKIGSTSANITEYVHSSLLPNTTYYYKVLAFNADGSSDFSEVFSLTTLSIPLAPSNISSASITKNSAIIRWSDNSNNENGFDIYYSLSATTNFTKIGTTTANIAEFAHSSLTPVTTYYYKVLAFNLEGSSDFSAVYSLTTLPLQKPLTPTDIYASSITKNSATIKWSDNSSNEYGFEIYSSLTETENFIKIGTTPANVTEFTNTSLVPNTTYYYKVLSFNGDGNSDSSDVFSLTTLPLQIPLAPTGLKAVNPDITQILVEWTDNSDNEESFELEKSEGDADHFKLLSKTSQNHTSFLDKNIISNINYYRVRSINSDGASGYSDTILVAFEIVDLPDAPTRLNIVSVGYDKTTLRWKDNSLNENGFEIERHGPDDASTINYFSVTANDSMFIDTRLSMSSEYTYFVRSFNNSGFSGYSNKVTINTLSIDPPVAPTELKTVEVTQNSVTIEWEDNSNNEAAYYVKRSLAGDTNNFKLIALNANVTHYTDSELTPGTNYIYSVFASNKAGNSPVSNLTVGYTLSISIEKRIKDGLIAYYNFSYDPELIIHDKSANLDPLDLYAQSSSFITWHENNSLELSSGADLISVSAASKIIKAVKKSNEISVECWIKPSEPVSYMDASIITIGDINNNVGFALNQTFSKGNNQPAFNYGVMLQTDSTSQNGYPEFMLNNEINYINLLHLVYTKDSTCNEKLYLNGILTSENHRSGGLNTWSDDYYLCLGSRPDKSNPWAGIFYTTAFYNIALTDSQIFENYSAGPTDNLVVYKNDFSIYVTPNPVTNTANVEIIPLEIQDIAPETVLRIIDMYGNKYYEEVLFDPGNNYIKSIDFSGYPKGVYAIQVLSYNTQQTSKFIIE